LSLGPGCTAVLDGMVFASPARVKALSQRGLRDLDGRRRCCEAPIGVRKLLSQCDRQYTNMLIIRVNKVIKVLVEEVGHLVAKSLDGLLDGRGDHLRASPSISLVTP
jgi:hypothetical protein